MHAPADPRVDPADALGEHATPTVRRVADLTPGALRAALRADARLLLPVGALVVQWPHLPVAACTIVADRLADDLSAHCRVLRAPTVNYGTSLPTPRTALGATSVRKKTLHRLLNDLLAEWEMHGVDEFILLTAHRYDPHLEALATVITSHARVRVVDALAVDCSDLLDSPAADADDVALGQSEEVAASLLLHLAPELVDETGAARDVASATAAKGARLYARVLGRIAERVLGSPAPQTAAPGREGST